MIRWTSKTISMSNTLLDSESSNFVVALGKAMHHYAAMEFLLNALISELVGDSLFSASFIAQSASKRVDLLAKLVERMESDLEHKGWKSENLFARAKVALQKRNKVAHNPFLATLKAGPQGSQVHTSGIHVVRYCDAGSKEEWIDLAELGKMIGESSALLQRFAELLTYCQAIRAQRTSAEA